MTTIYLIRHCEAAGNAKRIFQGSTDCDITETGARQLTFLAERFKDIPIDAVYSSPLMRAKKTALAIAEPRGLEVQIHSGLGELHGGVVEGRPFQESFNSIEGLADIWNNHPQDFAPEGGEPMRDAYERIWNAVVEIVKENQGKQIAAAAHGGVLRCLHSRLKFGTIERLAEVDWSENTAVTCLTFDDDMNMTVRYISDHSHVPLEFMPKRSRLIYTIDTSKK